jgi:hypothetical protein
MLVIAAGAAMLVEDLATELEQLLAPQRRAHAVALQLQGR